MAVTLLVGGTVLGREPELRDVLIAGGVIIAMSPPGELDAVARAVVSDEALRTVDLAGLTVIPGLVDGHLHVIGGGGGSGYRSRIPELPPDAILEAGITTCVAMPGVDTLSKPPHTLLAKARALNELGVRCYVMAGGFAWPPPTSTRDLRDEIYLLPEIVGVKIALNERLATAPTGAELERLMTELLWLRHTTGKACLLHVHLGTGTGVMELADALEQTGVPPDLVQVTHANYNDRVLGTAGELGRLGCWVDVNPLINPQRIAEAIDPTAAIAALLAAGVPVERITMSSDGNASVPRVLTEGSNEPFSFQLGLLEAVRDVAERGVLPADQAVSLVTSNPASALCLRDTGRIAAGAVADLVALDDEFSVRHVWSGGELRVAEGAVIAHSTFRDPRWH